MKKLGLCVYLFTIFFILLINGGATAIAEEQPKKEEAPPPPPPAPVYPERSYNAPYDILWDKIIETLKEKRLYIHPHGKTAEDKENGKLTKPTFRYFSIIQASKPVIEMDYSDQYIIMVIKPPEPKKEEPKAAEPAKKDAKGDAVAKNPAVADKKAEATAEKPAEAAPVEPQVPKGPPLIKVQIQRKFLKHNGLPNPQGAWAEADPKKENNIGISEEDLFKTLDLLVASIAASPPAASMPAIAPASATSAAPGSK
ncbi:MAG: hypothetical protein HZA13_09240 [Nitrospirae bacterium]|nr:hypothetical protein [Nitrospirota bacterium]